MAHAIDIQVRLTTAFPPRHVERPVMFQNWNSLTFLHWRYAPEVIQSLLPPGLTVDVFDGSAWVGITPFQLGDLRPPFAPALPWISSFPETNVRTYVLDADGEPGVWFFSLEAERLAAVLGARWFYGLPYRWADMHIEAGPRTVRYESHRHKQQRAATRMQIEIGEPLAAGELDIFLTARFRLYSMLHRKLAWADVEHEPWPLYTGRVAALEQNLIEADGLPRAEGEPLVHYSPGVHVRIGRISH